MSDAAAMANADAASPTIVRHRRDGELNI